MASSRRSTIWPVVTAVCGLVILILALPTEWKTWAPGFLSPDFRFGLDLAGGTQLDFRISEDEINAQLADIDAQIGALEGAGESEELTALRIQRQAIEAQRTNIVEAIRTVLEKRVNALGVSEAVITPSYVGDEKHLLVECPGVVDVQKCIETVGKTIQLEFKEEQTGTTPEFAADVRRKADEAYASLGRSGITLQTLGEDLGDELGMGWQQPVSFFRDQFPAGLDAVWNNPQPGQVIKLEGSLPTTAQDEQGNPVPAQVPGVFLIEALSPKTQSGRIVTDAPTAFSLLAKENPATVSYRLNENQALNAGIPTRVISTIRTMQPGDLRSTAMEDGSSKILFLRSYTPGREEVDVSHILIAYKGAQAAPATVTRTKEEALARAQQLKQQITGGARFEDLARSASDAESRQNAGALGAVTRNSIVPSFEQVAFTSKTGQISDPIESPFGYHIIRVNKEAHTTEDIASFDALTITGSGTTATASTYISRMQNGEIRTMEDSLRAQFLFFSLQPSGWKDTTLDGKHFRSASVTLDPTTNIPVVQILFDAEGQRIFQDLTKRNIGKRIAIFVGGELVTAPVVQSEITGGSAVITGSSNVEEAQLLAQNLNTGAIPAPIHLSGQRTVEATLGADSLQASVTAALIGVVVLMLYMLLIYRFLGVLANLALVVYAVIFLAILKLPLFLFTSQYIVLTLAGMAGMILSIGMAVDTNVLVFERVKEELRKGKLLKTAVDTGFGKAWPSIRDSNISTLITCALLFIIGTSIVRGFAVTLGMGVLISMFTGMIITRWITEKVADSSLANKPGLFPGMKKE